jgi:hypothetical protein
LGDLTKKREARNEHPNALGESTGRSGLASQVFEKSDKSPFFA